MADGDGWYRDFFHGLALDLWRQAVTPEETAQECALVAATMPDGPLLDVPCGNGRHALWLARQGRAVTGVDLAAQFLDEARAATGTLPVTWVQAEMEALPRLGPFAGAYCLGNSFGYSSHAGTRAFLSSLAGALAAGGKLLLHSGTVAECLLPSLPEKRELDVGDVHVACAHHYDAAASRLETRYTFSRGATRQTGVARYTVYTVGELVRLLDEAGLRVEALWGSFARAPFTLGAADLVVLARRV